MEYHLFCDEAGNTGPRYCDSQQPLFVAAGLLFPANTLERSRRLVRAALDDLNAARGTRYDEIRASRLMGSRHGRDCAARLLDELSAEGARTVVNAFDKHFSLAARFVDEFLDLSDNPRAGPEFCTDRALMRRTATVVSSLGLSVLESIEAAIRTPTLKVRRDAVAKVAEALRTRGHNDLAWVVEGALPSPSDPAANQTSALAFPDYTKSMTPNVAGFGALVIGADAEAKRLGATALYIVHDEIPEFESDLRHAHFLQSDKEAHDRIAAAPYTVSYPRAEVSQPPEFVASESEPLLQAADVLAGSVAYVLKAGIDGDTLDSPSVSLATVLFRAVGDGIVPNSGLVLSDDAVWLIPLLAQLPSEVRTVAATTLGLHAPSGLAGA